MAVCLEQFAKEGGIKWLVAGLESNARAATATAKLAEQAWLDAELASGDVSRMERAAAKLLDATDHHRQAGDSGLRPRGGDGDNQPEPVPPDAPSIAAMRAELDGLGLLD